MAITIFAENFRGFRWIDIDIEKNAFLVGDNSSGKTSFLHLISYVCETDLYGAPTLDQELNIGRYDFFSPYFNYADVTIGYHTATGDEANARLVTLKKDRKNATIEVNAFTCATEFGALSLRKSGRSVLGRYMTFETQPSREKILELHRSSRGFTKLDLPSSSGLNNPDTVIQATYKLAKDLTQSGSAGRLAFLAVVPSSRHIGPMRAQPESYYRFDRALRPSGAHFATLMQDLTDSSERSIPEIIRSFGKESRLFDDFVVKKLAKDVDDPPLHVKVVKNGRNFQLNQVGIGVSQVAPILAETLGSVSGLLNGRFFLIQQPELHLHPVAQAALGEYLFEMSEKGLTFIIETHSDFLIDRFRARIKELESSRPTNIIYCYSDGNGNHAVPIEIDSNGKLVDPPARYHEFFLKEIARTML